MLKNKFLIKKKINTTFNSTSKLLLDFECFKLYIYNLKHSKSNNSFEVELKVVFIFFLIKNLFFNI